ncbi:MAG: hypothetical protein HYY78_23055 [Betaproteobacteria bacterium]|nr:hypothetical protein [Betaproteobacteria bacterium]
METMRLRATGVLLLAMFIAWAAPLAGLAAAGQPVARFLDFPPRTEYVSHASFAWSAFIALSVPLLGAVALFASAIVRAKPAPAAASDSGRFPWWGWAALALIAAGWVLAWTEGMVPPGWRRHTFTPLWLGYVLAMNALAWRRTGRSPLTHRTAWFLSLFPVSAAFWWLFEHLNQFVSNWYYSGIHASGDWDYFLQATLPFSTVLPAVASTWAWLRGFPRLEALALPAVRGHASLAWLALLAGALALAGVGFRPEVLYPALWLGPLLVLCGLQHLLLGDSLLAPVARGDWRPLLQPALAALVCGFFWEFWNYGSLAKWHYSVPYVQRFHVFEMPLLGYAGYLPFGVVCALVMDLVARLVERGPLYLRSIA